MTWLAMALKDLKRMEEMQSESEEEFLHTGKARPLTKMKELREIASAYEKMIAEHKLLTDSTLEETND